MQSEQRYVQEHERLLHKSGFAKDGRPWSRDVDYSHIDYSLADDLSPEEHAAAVDWIKNNLIRIKSPNWKRSSYGIKHALQHDLKIYTTNNQFKDLMLECGYMPVNEHDLNWVYCVSQKSPAFL